MDSEWNPMENDYLDKQFNSYDHGPGINISSFNKDKNERAEIKLFIGNIPKLISEKALTNLFKRVGEVNNVYIIRKNENEKNFAFITFNKSEDASEAISRFNKFQFADSTCLHVALTKSKDQLSSNSRDKYSNGNYLEEFTPDQDSKPCKPIIFDQSLLISKKELAEDTALSNSGAPKTLPKLNPYDKEFKHCMQCLNTASFICSQCENMYFCSADCQKKIWPVHYKHCYPCLSSISDNFDVEFDSMSFENAQTYIDFPKEVILKKNEYKIIVCRVTKNGLFGFRDDRKLELINLAEQLNNVYCGSRCSNTMKYSNGNLYVCKIKENPIDMTDTHDDVDTRITARLGKEFRRVCFESEDADCIDNQPLGGRQTCSVFDVDSGAKFDTRLENLREFVRQVEIPIAQAVHCITYDDLSTGGPIRVGNMYSVQRMEHTKYVIIGDVKNE